MKYVKGDIYHAWKSEGKKEYAAANKAAFRSGARWTMLLVLKILDTYQCEEAIDEIRKLCKP